MIIIININYKILMTCCGMCFSGFAINDLGSDFASETATSPGLRVSLGLFLQFSFQLTELTEYNECPLLLCSG